MRDARKLCVKASKISKLCVVYRVDSLLCTHYDAHDLSSRRSLRASPKENLRVNYG